jgi:hypothetical protein
MSLLRIVDGALEFTIEIPFARDGYTIIPRNKNIPRNTAIIKQTRKKMDTVPKRFYSLMKQPPTRGFIKESAGAFSEVTGGRPPSFSSEKTRLGASEQKKRCQPFPDRVQGEALLNVTKKMGTWLPEREKGDQHERTSR